jgi:metallo-beta-lactamase class B
MTQDSTFKIGKYSFQTYYAGQGHAPDNIVIWFENEKILYGGCLVKSTEATDLGNIAEANLKKWVSAIKKLQNKFKDPMFIIPGHNDWTSRDALIHTLRLIRQYKNKK